MEAATVVGYGEGDDTWRLAGTAAYPEAMNNVDIYFAPKTTVTSSGEGDNLSPFGGGVGTAAAGWGDGDGDGGGGGGGGCVGLNADVDMWDNGLSSSLVTVDVVDDGVSANRNDLMRREVLYVNPEMPFPAWDDVLLNSDIMFEHWPDWPALIARTRDDAAVAASLLTEVAAWGADVGGGCGAEGGGGDGGDGGGDGGETRPSGMDRDHRHAAMTDHHAASSA